MKTLNVRQRHIHTLLSAINNKTLYPRRVVFFPAPRPSWKRSEPTFRGHCISFLPPCPCSGLGPYSV